MLELTPLHTALEILIVAGTAVVGVGAFIWRYAKRYANIESEIGNLKKETTGLHARLDTMDKRMDRRFDELKEYVDSRFDLHDKESAVVWKSIESTLERVLDRLDTMDKRLDHLDSEVSRIKGYLDATTGANSKPT